MIWGLKGDPFRQVLGYRSIIDGAGKSWEIHAEQSWIVPRQGERNQR
jgi:hypothetical protein